ncbi:S49 family peptidase [Roseateles sp. BYS180W]|uniref:S49 family peptidase n=1 Tax=Roseateles rivi TaxID=3299028 RepID=A0ABW7FSB4_9BURK
MNTTPQDPDRGATLPPPIPDATARPEDLFQAAGAPAPAVVPAEPKPAYEAVLAQFAQEYLRERRSERRWRLLLRLSWLGVLVVLVWALFVQGHHVAPPTSPHTALVEVRGEIAVDSEASAELVLSALKSAFSDQAARAVVLRVNSPGGSPVQAGIIYDEIRRLKQLHDKKVYVVVEEMCASGAYYIAAAADAIYVDKASMVGSIGVLMDGFGFTGLMEKLGIERRLVIAGENKGMLDPYLPVSPPQLQHTQAMLDQIHQQFIHVVREGRGQRLKETPEMFSGMYWNGEQAVKMGLADGMGNLDYVAREIVKAEEVIDYTPHDNVAERLAKRFGAAVGEGAVKALHSLPRLH